MESSTTYPRTQVEDPKRPYWIWDVTAKKVLPYRRYSILHNAHNMAMNEAGWSKTVGYTVEVFDARTGKLLGQYTRTMHSVKFRR